MQAKPFKAQPHLVWYVPVYLVRIVVNVLAGKVPGAVGDGSTVFVGTRPHLDVDAVGDLIVCRAFRLVSVAHQSLQQTVRWRGTVQ